MDFIIKALLIIFFSLTTLCANAQVEHAFISNIINNQGTISAPRNLEKDFLSAKDNNFSLSTLSNNSSINARRQTHEENGNSNDIFYFQTKQFNNIISYIYNQAYLEDKNELALLLLLHQIQPNAP